MNLSDPEVYRRDLSPFYHLVGDYNCRIQEYEMSQNLIAPVAWMLAIERYKPATVIEIGTCKGGLSNLLSSVVATYGGEFHTMDIVSGGQKNKYELYGNATFHLWDCFEHLAEITALIKREGLCFMLCDGGNKPKEFSTFAEIIKPGDVIAAHDWIDESVDQYSPKYGSCCEVPLVTIQGAIEKNRLVDFMPDWFELSAWCVKRKSL